MGFDSAWTVNKSGAIVGLIYREDGTFLEIGLPQTVNYPEAALLILKWQAEFSPTKTVIMLDQPTIVNNTTGQRAVENIVGSPVGRRYGGVQPANTEKEDMFGPDAPVWPFLNQFGGPADPMNPIGNTWVFETFPVLAIIALGWTLPDHRPTGRLPKYNPERTNKFSVADWQYICGNVAAAFTQHQLPQTSTWLANVCQNPAPQKSDQDCLDACLCLLMAIEFIIGNECLMVGDIQSGYMIVNCDHGLREELENRCRKTKRNPLQWVRVFQRALTQPN